MRKFQSTPLCSGAFKAPAGVRREELSACITSKKTGSGPSSHGRDNGPPINFNAVGQMPAKIYLYICFLPSIMYMPPFTGSVTRIPSTLYITCAPALAGTSTVDMPFTSSSTTEAMRRTVSTGVRCPAYGCSTSPAENTATMYHCRWRRQSWSTAKHHQ